MNRFVMSASTLLAVLTSAFAQDRAYPTNGAQLLQRTCKGCHDVHVVTSARKTDRQWEVTLNQMLSRGAKATDEEAEIIFNYLCDNFGADRAFSPSNNPPKGWHAEGAAQWNVAAGEIVGTLGGPGAGWLVLDKVYEDFALRFSFQCTNCEAGLLFRDKKAGTGSGGTYYSLAGPDINTAYRLTRDGGGREVDRQRIGSPADQNFHAAQIPVKPSGWNTVEIFVRGKSLIGVFNDYRTEPLDMSPTKPDQTRPYGSLALRLAGQSNAQLRIKDITVEDLTERRALAPEVTDKHFQQKKLTDLYYSEGIAAGDINRDGIKDVVAGPFYYLGPDYKVAKEIYHSETYDPSFHNRGTYTDSFFTYVHDFNGDKWPDILKVNFDGAFLYLNPRGESRHWDEYKVVSSVYAETPQFGDIDGDGRPELIMCQGKGPEIQNSYAKPDWSDPTKPWTIHPISEKGNWGHHGMGYGDINGDGRADLVQTSGWWEQPPAGSTSLWTFHAAPFSESEWTGMIRPFAGGADMFVYDVNGDGLPDVITSLGAHGWGLAWFEQKRAANGEISWLRHLIMGRPSDRQAWEETDKNVEFSELHALALADVDGDGIKDIITGKRWWSHGDLNSVPDAQSSPVLYWFKLVRKPGHQVQFVPHLINNNSGVGTQIAAEDMNGDGKVDILTAARKGAFVFINQN